MTRLTSALLLAAGLLLSAGTSTAAQNETQGEGLHSLMVAAGKLYFGNAMDTNTFNDAAYQAIASNKNEFGMITPENSLKWEATEAQQGKFAFTQADDVAQKVKTNGQMLRCHTLVWHSQLPTFVANGSWTPTTLTAVITAHITNVMTHYAGQCYAWDVVNEALNEDGSFRESVFFKTLGSSFLPLAFSTAAAADPHAKLYYNDFNLETSASKLSGALKIAALLQANHTPFHGVGFQAHLNVGQTPSRAALAGVLGKFTALGLEVAFTELDVAQQKVPADAAAQAQQAKDYVSVVGACLDVKGCVGITVWQFTDKYSWIPGTFPGKGEACLFTSDLKRKPAYDAVVALLKGAGEASGKGDNATAVGDSGGEGRSGSGSGSSAGGKVPFSGAAEVVRGLGGLGGLVGVAVGALLWL